MKDLTADLWPIFDAVEQNYIDTSLNSEIEDTALREKIHHRVNALRDIRRTIGLAIAQGASATAIIEKLSQVDRAKARKVKA